MSDNPSGRRVIDVGKKIPAPDEPRLRTVRERRLSDYPSLSQAHRDMVRVYSSPLLMGPPICDELVALVSHLFTEEEAGAVRHLGLVKGRTAAQVAPGRAPPGGRSASRSCTAWPSTSARSWPTAATHNARYRLLPILPGVFEMVLVTYTPETLTAWHRRFIELFEALYETGYGLDYAGVSSTLVRVLPVSRAIEAHPMALPTDQLAAIMDRFDHFAVGQCQCRTTARALGRGCDRPLGNCMVDGQMGPQCRQARMDASGLEAGGPGDQARGRVARPGQLDVERRTEQEPVLLLVLRMLLPCHAADRRVQRAEPLRPAPLPASIGPGQVRLLRRGARRSVRCGPSSWTATPRPTGTCPSGASAADCARWPAIRGRPSPCSRSRGTGFPTGVGSPRRPLRSPARSERPGGCGEADGRHRRRNTWGTVPIFVRRKWDCPLRMCDSCCFADPRRQVAGGTIVCSQ